tara:strand:- start:104 stop:490 length:387 start_codon:yes stop_codon:yes gene_type:complete
MSAQTLLSGGDKWFSYSGVLFGDVSAPATIQMVFIPNTGLRDSLITIEPYYGVPISTGTASGLGIEVKIDDVTVINQQPGRFGASGDIAVSDNFRLFIPRQSKLEILSLNTSLNNTQKRGVNIVGYYL